MNPPPVETYQPVHLTADEERLSALFDAMETSQVELFDQAAKRIIELTTVLLGVLFGVTAFGETFPPPYLAAFPAARWMIMAALALYLAAMLLAMRAIEPRRYIRSPDPAQLRVTLDAIIGYKARWLRFAGAAFFGGSLLLVVLVVGLLLAA